ncbi:MAG: hypothetical protein H6834_09865 [Planctomycetes bacterium]|nr:hypothetical protein [Planctomycetota bacterium]
MLRAGTHINAIGAFPPDLLVNSTHTLSNVRASWSITSPRRAQAGGPDPG